MTEKVGKYEQLLFDALHMGFQIACEVEPTPTHVGEVLLYHKDLGLMIHASTRDEVELQTGILYGEINLKEETRKAEWEKARVYMSWGWLPDNNIWFFVSVREKWADCIDHLKKANVLFNQVWSKNRPLPCLDEDDPNYEIYREVDSISLQMVARECPEAFKIMNALA